MLARLSGRAADCYLREEAAKLAAERATSELTRNAYLDIARTWNRLAESYQMAEQISDYLEWSANRLRK
jgi:hypothetical protein